MQFHFLNICFLSKNKIDPPLDMISHDKAIGNIEFEMITHGTVVIMLCLIRGN